MNLREEGNGGILELYDPSGRRIVVNDLDTRIRGIEARIRLVELAQEKSGVASPKIDTDNPFDKRP